MNLDDLKLEILSRVPEKDHYTAHWIIDYLNTQGRIMPDGYVAVPEQPKGDVICDMVAAFSIHQAPTTAMLAVYKAMIAARKDAV